ncbi:hypothetical protein FSP39_010927, partial [Pinctada imbricata]
QDTDACSSVQIFSRDTWGARNPVSYEPFLPRSVALIFIHHTAGPSCVTKESCASILRDIQGSQIDELGWHDINDNFFVGEDGRIYEGRGWMRVGAHTRGYNNKSLSVSVIGNFTSFSPNETALDAVRSFLTCALETGYLEKDYGLYAHREVSDTECPGDAFYMEIKDWSHYNGTAVQDTVSCANTAVLSRDTWGARNPISINQLQSPVGMVFIHHTDGLGCTTVERCVSILKGIQRFHIDTRGWDDIAYSFLVGDDGRIYEGRGWRRVGSHTKGYNSRSLAISVMGSFSNVVPNKAALDAVRSLLTCARNAGYIDSSYTLYGHRDVGITECPGEALYNIIRSWPHYNGTSGKNISLIVRMILFSFRNVIHSVPMEILMTFVLPFRH